MRTKPLPTPLQVIKGGIKAWVKAAAEVELVPEGNVPQLPRFD